MLTSQARRTLDEGDLQQRPLEKVGQWETDTQTNHYKTIRQEILEA